MIQENKQVLSYALISLFILLFVQNCPASENVFKIGVEDLDYYPHYSYKNEEYKGFARDLLDQFAKSKNYKFIYVALPVKRLLSNYIKGKVDFKYPDSQYWGTELKKKVSLYYSLPVVQYIDGVMVTPLHKNFGLESLKTLGTVIGFTPWDYMGLINSKSITLEESHNMHSLFQMVIKNRINGAYVNVAVANHILEDSLKQPGALVFNPNLPHTKDFYRLSSIKHPQVIKEFDNFLNDKKQLVSKLKKNYKIESFTTESELADITTDVKKNAKEVKNTTENKTEIKVAGRKSPVKKKKKIVRPLIIQSSRGFYVEELQNILKAKGLYTGKINGIFGAKLTKAVKKFQKANSLKSDGMVGPLTWKLLTTEDE